MERAQHPLPSSLDGSNLGSDQGEEDCSHCELQVLFSLSLLASTGCGRARLMITP